MLAVALLCAACGSTPKEQFYTLAPAPSAAPQTAAGASRYRVSMGPVRLPEAVDRPQLMLREGGNRVRILEMQRWAGPLSEEIGRALIAGLERQLPEAQVSSSTAVAGRDAAFRVLVDIQRFDAAADAGVMVQGFWTIAREGAAPLSGQFAASETLAAGTGYDAIAAAYSRSLDAVSQQIAAAIRQARGSAP
jgi:uncharacterized lipoprotein YmbA